MSLWKTTHALWPSHPRERLKLALGRLLFPRQTQAWLSFLQSDALLWRQVPVFPKLVTRIYRPYALRTLSSRQRVEHMIGHYRALHDLGLRGLLERSVEQPLKLLDLSTKNKAAALLQLVSVHDGHREGEAHLQLIWNGHRLYALSFLLRAHGDGCELLVTRLQGPNHAQAREQIREATKGLHGLRPATLMVQAVRQLASSMGCARVLLVSHRLRVTLNPMRRWKIPANLESLWLELGARPRTDGLFELSTQVQVSQDFSDVASSKRAEARRKADLLLQTLQAIDANIQALAQASAQADGGGSA